MSRMNRGAMTNLRHILYDIIGNIFIYVVCHFVFFIFYGRVNIDRGNTFIAACLYILIFFFYCHSTRLYDISTFYYPDRVLRVVFMGCVLATAVVSSTFYFSGRAQANRDYYLLYYLLSVMLHLATSYLSFQRNRRISGSMRTLMIGRKEGFDKFNGFMRKTNVSARCAGYMVLAKEDMEDSPDNVYLGCVESGDLGRVLQDAVIDQVYIMRESGRSAAVRRCVDLCMEWGIVTHVVVPMDRDDCGSYISSMGTYPVISYHMGCMNTGEQAIKRLMDIIGSSVGLLLSLPIMAVAAIAIKMDSPGPVLFSQTRVGHNGRRFKIYKLRTMTTDAECRKQELLALNEMQGAYMFKIKEDPRVTKVGAFLRKTSIDELPQFFNVLAGNMSLVGTRPPTEDEVNRYERYHWKRLRIKPGITGLWQISGRNKITSFDDIVEMDTQYIQSWSLLSDIRILYKTVGVVLKRNGAS